jgi:hypothetical protein
MLLFNISQTKMAYFSKIHYPTPFEDPKESGISIATTSQVLESTMSLLPVAGN